MLDIDWFKQINDRHGHPAGDAVLVQVARRLTAGVRAGEVLARVGGEEFAWLLPEARLSDAVQAAPAGRLTMSAGVGVMHAPGTGMRSTGSPTAPSTTPSRAGATAPVV